MSKCWRCNNEFYNPYSNNTLCDECLGRQPKTTTIDGLSKRIFEEKLIPSHCLEQYEKYEKQLEEKDKEIEKQDYKMKILISALNKSCNILRELNFKLYNTDEIDFENIFMEESRKEINDERKRNSVGDKEFFKGRT